MVGFSPLGDAPLGSGPQEAPPDNLETLTASASASVSLGLSPGIDRYQLANVTASPSLSLTSDEAQVLSVSGAGAASLVLAQGYPQGLAATAAATAALSFTDAGYGLPATASGSATIERLLSSGRVLTSAATAGASLSRHMEMELSATAACYAALSYDAAGFHALTLQAFANGDLTTDRLAAYYRALSVPAAANPYLKKPQWQRIGASGEPIFPESIRPEPLGGPTYVTSVMSFVGSREEQRRVISAVGQARWRVELDVRAMLEVSRVVAFFGHRGGRWKTFLFKDWSDFKSVHPNATVSETDQEIGIGNGSFVNFQMTKTYTAGSTTYVRKIVRPRRGTVVVALNGALLAEGSHYTIDYSTGIVTFTSPPNTGLSVTWGGEFWNACRFDADNQEISVRTFEHGSLKSIDIVEVTE